MGATNQRHTNPLLETDQAHCYSSTGQSIPCQSTGQDAALPKRQPWTGPDRFRVKEAVVEDRLTGALWSKTANPAEFPLSWPEAQAFVARMHAEHAYGYQGWQLPPRWLLFSLLSHQHINPALPAGHPFRDVFEGYYWTADKCARLPDQSWYVHLGGGRVQRGMQHGFYMVWPVSLKNTPARFCPNPPERWESLDAGMMDTCSGLIWSLDANPAAKRCTWDEALALTESFNRRKLGGRQDWRLPNIRELASLIDLRAHSPALPQGHPFKNVQEAYWSSTTSVYEPRYAWSLYLQDGNLGVGFKPRPEFHIWPVSAGWHPES